MNSLGSAWTNGPRRPTQPLVNTTDQSCDMQLHELRQYVQRRDWQVFAEYADTGFRGAAASRPERDRLLRDARPRKFEGVVVWKLGPLEPQRGPLRPQHPRVSFPLASAS
jgi:hypothetical protein